SNFSAIVRFFFFQAVDGIRDFHVTGVQTCALPIWHRQAYHDLIDPQGGLRTGTQLLFLDGALQYRNSELKLEHLDLLAVNSYNPINPFNTPLSWGFNLGWTQEALDRHGQFSEDRKSTR